MLLRFLRDYFIYDESKNYSNFDIEANKEEELHKPMGMFETIAEAKKAIWQAESRAEGLNLSKQIIRSLQAGNQPEAIAQEYAVDINVVFDLKDTLGL